MVVQTCSYIVVHAQQQHFRSLYIVEQGTVGKKIHITSLFIRGRLLNGVDLFKIAGYEMVKHTHLLK